MLKFTNPATKNFDVVSGLAISGRECWLLGRINFSWAKIHNSLPESIRRKDHWIQRLRITKFHHFPLQNLISLEIFQLKTVELDSCPSIRRLNLEDFVCQFDCFPCFSNSDCLVGIQSHRCDFKKFPKVPPAWFSLTLKKWGSGVDTCGQKWQVPRKNHFLLSDSETWAFFLSYGENHIEIGSHSLFRQRVEVRTPPPLIWGLI